MILVEAAVETLDGACTAVAEGAGRLELCADLARGGVTPSAGLLRAVRAAVDQPLFVMIRPRPGDFVYHSGELDIMLADIAEARRAGADGVVFGALTPAGEVDRGATERLIAAARPLPVTFHRAVDQARDLTGALTVLAALGVERVLTSGGAATAEQGLPVLVSLAAAIGRRVRILPGGGIRAGNAGRIARELGATELHVGVPLDAEAGRVAAIAAALSRPVPG